MENYEGVRIRQYQTRLRAKEVANYQPSLFAPGNAC